MVYNEVSLPCAVRTDFNGDGYGDLVVGAPGANSGIGRAYIVYGSPLSFDASLDLAALRNGEGEVAGLLVSGSDGGMFSYNIGYAVAAAG